MTHTYNALPPLHHRAPGAVGAALLDKDVYCSVICDGLHVDPAMVELILKCKGADKTILVSDAAYIGTSQNKLVGSSIVLKEAVTNLVYWGLTTFAEAITMASYNPAKALGFDGIIGHIAPGKKADLLLWHKETLKPEHVILNGQLITQKNTTNFNC
jgi:N-acetylglucosamine-6-phosphate deacetylase